MVEFDIKDRSSRENDPYIKEFEKWNFSNLLLQRKYSTQDILEILLTSSRTLQNVKMSLLKKMINDIRYIAPDMDEEYKQYIRENNNEVRETLRCLFKTQDPRKMRHQWFTKFWKYNDANRKLYGGKWVKDILSVDNIDHERHLKYLIKKQEHVESWLKYLIKAKINNFDKMIKLYISMLWEKEFLQIVEKTNLTENQKIQIKNSAGLYTT